MKYVKCSYCPVGTVETKQEATSMLGLEFTSDVAVNTLNSSPVCDACLKTRKENSGQPFAPYDNAGKFKSNDLY